MITAEGFPGYIRFPDTAETPMVHINQNLWIGDTPTSTVQPWGI